MAMQAVMSCNPYPCLLAQVTTGIPAQITSAIDDARSEDKNLIPSETC